LPVSLNYETVYLLYSQYKFILVIFYYKFILLFTVLINSLHRSEIIQYSVLMSCLSAGSKDGFLRFWKCGQEYRSLVPLFTLPMVCYLLQLFYAWNTVHIAVDQCSLYVA